MKAAKLQRENSFKHRTAYNISFIGELFVKVFGMSRDFEGAHIHFKMAASV